MLNKGDDISSREPSEKKSDEIKNDLNNKKYDGLDFVTPKKSKSRSLKFNSLILLAPLIALWGVVTTINNNQISKTKDLAIWVNEHGIPNVELVTEVRRDIVKMAYQVDLIAQSVSPGVAYNNYINLVELVKNSKVYQFTDLYEDITVLRQNIDKFYNAKTILNQSSKSIFSVWVRYYTNLQNFFILTGNTNAVHPMAEEEHSQFVQGYSALERVVSKHISNRQYQLGPKCQLLRAEVAKRKKQKSEEHAPNNTLPASADVNGASVGAAAAMITGGKAALSVNFLDDSKFFDNLDASTYQSIQDAVSLSQAAEDNVAIVEAGKYATNKESKTSKDTSEQKKAQKQVVPDLTSSGSIHQEKDGELVKHLTTEEQKGMQYQIYDVQTTLEGQKQLDAISRFKQNSISESPDTTYLVQGLIASPFISLDDKLLAVCDAYENSYRLMSEELIKHRHALQQFNRRYSDILLTINIINKKFTESKLNSLKNGTNQIVNILDQLSYLTIFLIILVALSGLYSFFGLNRLFCVPVFKLASLIEEFNRTYRVPEPSEVNTTEVQHVLTCLRPTFEEVRITKQKNKDLMELNNKLGQISFMDGLTQLYNRRALDEIIAKSPRLKENSAIFMLDIDNFKKLNDTEGHQRGDEILRLVARTIRMNVSQTKDMVYRYGGEEFCVMLTELSYQNAIEIAKRLVQRIEQMNVINKGTNSPVTISLGVSIYNGLGSAEILKHIQRADEALYQAKHNGRNQFAVYNQMSIEQ